MSHVIQRITILGTGLIGGSFALALRKYATDLHITGFDAGVARGRSDLRRVAYWRDD
jgi:prephenate dehydrogenase